MPSSSDDDAMPDLEGPETEAEVVNRLIHATAVAAKVEPEYVQEEGGGMPALIESGESDNDTVDVFETDELDSGLTISDFQGESNESEAIRVARAESESLFGVGARGGGSSGGGRGGAAAAARPPPARSAAAPPERNSEVVSQYAASAGGGGIGTRIGIDIDDMFEPPVQYNDLELDEDVEMQQALARSTVDQGQTSRADLRALEEKQVRMAMTQSMAEDPDAVAIEALIEQTGSLATAAAIRGGRLTNLPDLYSGSGSSRDERVQTGDSDVGDAVDGGSDGSFHPRGVVGSSSGSSATTLGSSDASSSFSTSSDDDVAYGSTGFDAADAAQGGDSAAVTAAAKAKAKEAKLNAKKEKRRKKKKLQKKREKRPKKTTMKTKTKTKTKAKQKKGAASSDVETDGDMPGYFSGSDTTDLDDQTSADEDEFAGPTIVGLPDDDLIVGGGGAAAAVAAAAGSVADAAKQSAKIAAASAGGGSEASEGTFESDGSSGGSMPGLAGTESSSDSIGSVSDGTQDSDGAGGEEGDGPQVPPVSPQSKKAQNADDTATAMSGSGGGGGSAAANSDDSSFDSDGSDNMPGLAGASDTDSDTGDGETDESDEDPEVAEAKRISKLSDAARDAEVAAAQTKVDEAKQAEEDAQRAEETELARIEEEKQAELVVQAEEARRQEEAEQHRVAFELEEKNRKKRLEAEQKGVSAEPRKWAMNSIMDRIVRESGPIVSIEDVRSLVDGNTNLQFPLPYGDAVEVRAEQLKLKNTFREFLGDDRVEAIFDEAWFEMMSRKSSQWQDRVDELVNACGDETYENRKLAKAINKIIKKVPKWKRDKVALTELVNGRRSSNNDLHNRVSFTAVHMLAARYGKGLLPDDVCFECISLLDRACLDNPPAGGCLRPDIFTQPVVSAAAGGDDAGAGHESRMVLLELLDRVISTDPEADDDDVITTKTGINNPIATLEYVMDQLTAQDSDAVQLNDKGIRVASQCLNMIVDKVEEAWESHAEVLQAQVPGSDTGNLAYAGCLEAIGVHNRMFWSGEVANYLMAKMTDMSEKTGNQEFNERHEELAAPYNALTEKIERDLRRYKKREKLMNSQMKRIKREDGMYNETWGGVLAMLEDSSKSDSWTLYTYDWTKVESQYVDYVRTDGEDDREIGIISEDGVIRPTMFGVDGDLDDDEDEADAAPLEEDELEASFRVFAEMMDGLPAEAELPHASVSASASEPALNAAGVAASVFDAADGAAATGAGAAGKPGPETAGGGVGGGSGGGGGARATKFSSGAAAIVAKAAAEDAAAEAEAKVAAEASATAAAAGVMGAAAAAAEEAQAAAARAKADAEDAKAKAQAAKDNNAREQLEAVAKATQERFQKEQEELFKKTKSDVMESRETQRKNVRRLHEETKQRRTDEETLTLKELQIVLEEQEEIERQRALYVAEQHEQQEEHHRQMVAMQFARQREQEMAVQAQRQMQRMQDARRAQDVIVQAQSARRAEIHRQFEFHRQQKIDTHASEREAALRKGFTRMEDRLQQLGSTFSDEKRAAMRVKMQEIVNTKQRPKDELFAREMHKLAEIEESQLASEFAKIALEYKQPDADPPPPFTAGGGGSGSSAAGTPIASDRDTDGGNDSDDFFNDTDDSSSDEDVVAAPPSGSASSAASTAGSDADAGGPAAAYGGGGIGAAAVPHRLHAGAFSFVPGVPSPGVTAPPQFNEVDTSQFEGAVARANAKRAYAQERLANLEAEKQKAKLAAIELAAEQKKQAEEDEKRAEEEAIAAVARMEKEEEERRATVLAQKIQDELDTQSWAKRQQEMLVEAERVAAEMQAAAEQEAAERKAVIDETTGAMQAVVLVALESKWPGTYRADLQELFLERVQRARVDDAGAAKIAARVDEALALVIRDAEIAAENEAAATLALEKETAKRVEQEARDAEDEAAVAEVARSAAAIAEQEAVAAAEADDAASVSGSSVHTAISEISEGGAQDEDPDRFSIGKHDSLEFTRPVVRWLQSPAPQVYKHKFSAIMHRLATGERNPTIAKQLKGCSTPIYESRLSMKQGGMRILWQTRKEKVPKKDGHKSIIVWHVAHHDDVNAKIKEIQEIVAAKSDKYLKEIDKAYSRMPLEDGTIAGQNGNMHNFTPEILIDPEKNTPLPIYLVSTQAFGDTQLTEKYDFTKWHPDLRLTKEEIEVGLDRETHVLLGRSGTGKTVCVVARMIRDTEENEMESRLFVARSKKLRNHVKREVEKRAANSTSLLSKRSSTRKLKADVAGYGSGGTVLSTLDEFLDSLAKMPALAPFMEGIPAAAVAGRGRIGDEKWSKYTKVTFNVFERDIWPKIKPSKAKCTKFKNENQAELQQHFLALNAVLTSMRVWGEIRSFIKGSIKAAQSGAPLVEAEYMDKEMGRRRDDDAMRRYKPYIYECFQMYQKELAERGSWDEMDRAMAVCAALQQGILETRSPNSKARFLRSIGAQFSKIYVDEVQDATQAELGVLGYCCTGPPSSMFFAGDTAQTIEQGANFNFADTRIMAKAVFGAGTANQINKKQVLTHNYRSHQGILNVAAQFVRKLCEHFPNGIDNAEDKGIALGPRPVTVCGKEAARAMLQSERYVILYRDDNEVEGRRFREYLEAEDKDAARTHSMFGIREFKGLEETHICIYGFFGGIIKDTVHKGWLQVFEQGRAKTKMPVQMEYELKLLYTAVTRCRAKLVFVEPTYDRLENNALKKTCDAFNRWLTERDLGTVATKDTIDSDSIVMTADDWVIRGARYANNAISELTMDEGMIGMEEDGIEPKFLQAKNAFYAAGETGVAHMATLQGQIEVYKKQILLVKKQKEVLGRSRNAEPLIGEPEPWQVGEGDLFRLVLPYERENMPEKSIAAGTHGEIESFPPNAKKAVVYMRRNMANTNLTKVKFKISQLRLCGPSTIDRKIETALAQLTIKALECHRIQNALELISAAKTLPAEEHGSADEADPDDEVPAVGWVERRKAFFRKLITGARMQLRRIGLDPDEFQ